MAKLNPQEATQKWVQNLSSATQQVAQGVQRVQQAPGVAAARQRQAWLAKVQASQEKWARNVSRVSLQEWQQSMLNVGVPRIAQGAQAKQGKMEAFLTDFLPFQDRVTAQVRQMPKVTLEDGIARMTAQVRGTAQFKRGGASGVGGGTQQ